MKKILLPTDFSNNAFHALTSASELLKNEECQFFVLNVFTEKKGFKSDSIEDAKERKLQNWKEEATTRLERFVNRIKKQGENQKHTYKLLAKRKDLIHAIDKLVDKLDIDLIVMGNKGKKSSIPLFLGKTATQTLHHVNKCAVLTIAKNTSYAVPKQIAFVTDLKKSFTANDMEPLKHIALLNGTPIQIVHIDEKEQMDKSQQSNLDELLSYLKPTETAVHHMPNFISKAKIIEVFIKETGIDMLVMVNNKHGFLEKMLREPIIEKMVFNIDIPFLVIPEKS
ncbi:universal stress protein [Maribacter aestuarii]|uniref:universal stress protein n=1 Tax=Maribacter aestuarii TaxID=1130723 RepID=UPI00248D186A|nr:universal stress protein [Maribacter aestuarii]